MRRSERGSSGTRLKVECGQETGQLDVSLYGPGGGSRCIKFGEHLITPIEFEALAGKKTRNWKVNIKVDGKPIKSLFENNTLKNCEKSCFCTNCLIGRKYPTDLELLIEKVYLNKPYDLSIVKKEKEDKDVKKKMLDNKPEDASSDVKDEFFSSPETTPKKKAKRSSMETPVDEILPVENNSPTTSESSPKKPKDATNPIHVVTSHPVTMSPILSLSDNLPEDRMIRDEMAPAPSKQQKDIRSFFGGKSPRTKGVPDASSPRSPGARSDCSVELVAEGRPRRKVETVDLTDAAKSKSPQKRGPGRPPRAASAASSTEGNDLLAILREEKKKVLSPRKKLPRDAKDTKEGTSGNSMKSGDKRKGDTESNDAVIKKSKVSSRSDEKAVTVTNERSKRNAVTMNSSAVQPVNTKKEAKMNGGHPSPVKVETPDREKARESPDKVSPSKLPTYTTMVRAALEEMNCVGGEGCTKLEILLYILRKFRPKGNVEQITTKLIQVLEIGTKKGDFLSSESLPRVLKKDTKDVVKKEKEVKKEPKDNGKTAKTVVDSKKKLVNDKKKIKSEVKVQKSSSTKKTKEEPSANKVKAVAPPVPKKLLEPLSTICKAKKLTRPETIRRLWAYIKLKKLQDPGDKTTIICDEHMKKMTKKKKIKQNTLLSYIKPFMIPMKTKQ